MDVASAARAIDVASAIADDAVAVGSIDDETAADIAGALYASLGGRPGDRRRRLDDAANATAAGEPREAAAASATARGVLAKVSRAQLRDAPADADGAAVATTGVAMVSRRLTATTAEGYEMRAGDACGGAVSLPVDLDFSAYADSLETSAYCVDVDLFGSATVDASQTQLTAVASPPFSFDMVVENDAVDDDGGGGGARRRLRRGGFTSSGSGGLSLRFDDASGPAPETATVVVNVTCDAGQTWPSYAPCGSGVFEGEAASVECDGAASVTSATCVSTVSPGCVAFDEAADAWVPVCEYAADASADAGATVCNCSASQVEAWAAYDGATHVAASTDEVFVAYYGDLLGAGVTKQIYEKTALVLYTLAGVAGACLLLGLWGLFADRRAAAEGADPRGIPPLASGDPKNSSKLSTAVTSKFPAVSWDRRERVFKNSFRNTRVEPYLESVGIPSTQARTRASSSSRRTASSSGRGASRGRCPWASGRPSRRATARARGTRAGTLTRTSSRRRCRGSWARSTTSSPWSRR